MPENLIELLPPLKRAREYYLYDQNGNRYLDLYLDGGRAICGHRPNGLSNVLKNALSRGIYAPYPSVYEKRLDKILIENFSDFAYRGVYRSLESFQKLSGNSISFSDPLSSEKSTSQIWRPYLSVKKDVERLLLELPFPGNDTVIVLSKDDDLPARERISPVVEAGLVRSWFDLLNRVNEANEEDWAAFDKTGHWKRQGPYLQALCSEKEYAALFKQYLSSGILISPDYSTPSICAVLLKEGSLKRLYQNLEVTNDK